MERSSNQESIKGRKASVERKVGECYQWNAIGQCSKGDSCNFSNGRASGNRCDQRQKKDSRPLFAPKAQAQTDEQKPSKVQVAEEKVLLEQEAEFRADISIGESVRIGHVSCGTLRVSITSLNQDAPTREGWWAAQVKSRRQLVERISLHFIDPRRMVLLKEWYAE